MCHIEGVIIRIFGSVLFCGLIHGRATRFLDHEDWEEYVESPHEIIDYDVVVPTLINSERHRRSEVNDLLSKLTFTAFGENYELNLSPSHKFFSPDLTIENVHRNGTIEKNKLPFDTDCFYDGHVVSHNSSDAVVSICDKHIRGIISTSELAVFITPLRASHAQEYARRYKRDSDKFHLVYKRSVDGIRRFCGVKDPPEEESNEAKAAQFNPASPGNSFIAPKYLEINLILDVDFVNKYADHVVIATTIMNAVSRRFSDPTLGISLRLFIVRMVILGTDTPTIDGASFTVNAVLGQNGDTLDSVRAWSIAVNPQSDDDPGHWDNVVIISGKTLISQGDTSGNILLGLAFNSGTCFGELGVSISTDLGLASAFVIAHEIGHTLTLQHDEDIGCAEGFIMSGILLPGSNASLWSSCSRTDLQNYLRWQLPDYPSECMDDIPVGVNALQTLELPGRIYSWDQQCDMLIPGSNSCGDIDCSDIACVGTNGACSPQGSPVAEGTPCGVDSICLAGVCSPEIEIPLPVAGGWSDWTETSCSRTCGGGVIIRQRVCNNPAPVFGGSPCSGEGVEFRLCNIDSCQTTSDDFRDEQCAATQSQPTSGGDITQWTHFFGLSSVINEGQYCLNPCQSMELMVIALRPPQVNTDGTECWDYTQADESVLLRCVGGTCQRFGCDGLQGGNLQVFDVCRLCGGDGSTCIRQAGNGTASMATVFNQIVEIPAGSTSVLITNHNVAGGNHIAIISPVSGDIFRGTGSMPDLTTRAFVGPYVIVHELTSTTETFRIPGPIPEPLIIELFLTSIQTSPIQYEYYSATFFWNIGNFGPCSATCNGVQIRTVTCTSGVLGGVQSIVPDTTCESSVGPKPETTRSCNVLVCPQWVAGEFGECTGVCGSGTQTRMVTCQQGNTIVSNAMCDPLLEPQSQQTCDLGDCVWVSGPFSPCSVTCGSGTQTTMFVCRNNLFPVADNECLDPMPFNSRTCFAGSCDIPRWVIASAFSKCSTKCGKGTQQRLVQCRIGTQVIEDNNCDNQSMPHKSQDCISIRCLLGDDCKPIENPFVRRSPDWN